MEADTFCEMEADNFINLPESKNFTEVSFSLKEKACLNEDTSKSANLPSVFEDFSFKSPPPPPKPKKTITIEQLVGKQTFEGFWSDFDLIETLYSEALAALLAPLGCRTAAITYVVIKWIERNHPGNEYSLILKKAKNWLKKQPTPTDLPALIDPHL